jgi:hypothetical protein
VNQKALVYDACYGRMTVGFYWGYYYLFFPQLSRLMAAHLELGPERFVIGL